MSRFIELTDEEYQTIEQVAAARGETPRTMLTQWLAELRERDHEPHYYETDDWFRHLGATEEQIAEAKRIARARSGAGDAHT